MPKQHFARDELTGMIIKTSITELEMAIKELNMRIIQDGDACLNDFYELLGLEPIALGVDVGWSSESPSSVTVRCGAAVWKKERPILTYWLHPTPRAAFGRS